ncbi:MAG: glycosyltransferase [Acidobacteria bacterium]|nr:glycosyltransferase [Acidobacteriota bacterium]
MLSRAISSVQRQDPPVWEIIVVDDGSTDDTGTLVGTLSSGDPRVTYLRQANAGVASARNTGIRRSTGTWIAFLDSDDEWLAGRVERIRGMVINRPGVEFTHSDRRVVDQDGQCLEPGRSRVSASEGADRRFLLEHWWIKTSTVVVRAALLERVGSLFNERLRTCEDYELFWRLVAEAEEIAYDTHPSVLVHTERHSLSTALAARDRYRDHIAAMTEVLGWAAGTPRHAGVTRILNARLRQEYRNALTTARATGLPALVAESAWLTQYLARWLHASIRALAPVRG